MANDYFDFKIVACFLPQVALGTYNATLAALNDNLLATNGLVLGSADTGEQRSGISFKTKRVFSEKADVAGSYTKSFSDFLREEVESLSFTFPLCGNRATASGAPADSEFTPIAGVDALLRSAGLTGAARSGAPIGWDYVPASSTPMSVLLFNGEGRYQLMDCFSQITIDFPPGGIPQATCEISVGSVSSFTNIAFPGTITYGVQQTVSAAVCESMVNTWSEERGADKLELVLGGTINDIDDINAAGGVYKLQTAREIRVKATLKGDSTAASEVFEHSQLVATALGTLTGWSWTLGPLDGAAGVVIRRIVFTVPKPELVSLATKSSGGKQVWDVEAVAKSVTTLNDEFSMSFR